MKEKISVIIADKNRDFKEKMKNTFSLCEDFKIIATTDNGEKVVELVKEYRPKLLICDLILDGCDGMEMLHNLHNLPIRRKPVVIVVSAMADDRVIRESIEYGANYFLAKPCSQDAVLKIAKNLMNKKNEEIIFNIDEEKSENNSYLTNSIEEIMEEKVTNIIHRVGIPAHIKGYTYLRNAIIKTALNADMINSVTKELYPQVAKDYNTTPSRVERAIRHAIEVAWNRGEEETLQSIFGYTIQSNKGKPTNSEFIAMIADRLRLQNRSLLIR